MTGSLLIFSNEQMLNRKTKSVWLHTMLKHDKNHWTDDDDKILYKILTDLNEFEIFSMLVMK